MVKWGHVTTAALGTSEPDANRGDGIDRGRPLFNKRRLASSIRPAGCSRTNLILYGYPAIEAFEQSERNEIKLGGCVLMEGQPERHCTSCGHEWQIVRRKSPWDIPDFPL